MTTPTIPVTPATDEEVEAARRYGPVQKHNMVDALIARIDAEQSRAEALYASCERLHHEAGEWKARAEKAEAQNARMRGVLLRAGGTDCEGIRLNPRS